LRKAASFLATVLCARLLCRVVFAVYGSDCELQKGYTRAAGRRLRTWIDIAVERFEPDGQNADDND
jgi:hypothetical protein